MEEARTFALTPHLLQDSVKAHHPWKLVVASPVVLTGSGQGSCIVAKLGEDPGEKRSGGRERGMSCPPAADPDTWSSIRDMQPLRTLGSCSSPQLGQDPIHIGHVAVTSSSVD